MKENYSVSRGPARRPKLIIADDCADKLEMLAEGAIRRNPELADRLLGELGRARIVPRAKLPANVVSIGREVTYRDEATGQEKTVTPVYPEAADIAPGADFDTDTNWCRLDRTGGGRLPALAYPRWGKASSDRFARRVPVRRRRTGSSMNRYSRRPTEHHTHPGRSRSMR